MKLKNKLAVVTGASTGIGRAIAVELARVGAKVFLLARTEKKLDESKKLIEKEGGRAEVVAVDLSNIDSINRAIKGIKTKANRVDILVNVAGIWHAKDEVYANRNLESFPQKVILDTYTVGFTAPTFLVNAFIPIMPKHGKILNISGTFESGAKGWLPYYASKRAIEDLTVGLSQELENRKIQVNCISPSDTATEAYKKYFPQYINEATDPQEIAKFAVFLCSENSAGVTGKIFVLKKGKKPYEKFHA